MGFSLNQGQEFSRWTRGWASHTEGSGRGPSREERRTFEDRASVAWAVPVCRVEQGAGPVMKAAGSPARRGPPARRRGWREEA